MLQSIASHARRWRPARLTLLACVLAAALAGPAAGSSYTITYGQSKVVTTTSSSEKAKLTFSGTAGDRVSMRISGVTMSPYASTGVNVSIATGSTTVTGSSFLMGRNGAFMEPVTLPSTGSYTITLDPQNTYTGSATVQIWKVPADATGSATEGGAGVTISMNTPGQNGSVTFAASSGDRVSIKLSGVSIGTSTLNSATISVLTPASTALVPSFKIGTSAGFVDPVNLTPTGTYTVVVDPRTYFTGSITVSVYAVSADQSASLTVGTQLPLSFASSSPGQNASVTFAGTSGQHMSLNVSTVTIGSSLTSGTNVTILKPDSTVLTGATAVGTPGKFFEPVTLPATGTYTILVDPQGSNTGSLNLDLYNPPADSTGTLTAGGAGTTFSVASTAAGQNGTFTFNGSLNQRISMNFSNVTIGSLVAGTKVTVKKPDGTTLVSALDVGTIGAFVDTMVLPAGGTYTVKVDPQGANTGSMQINLYTVPANVTGTLTAGSSQTVTNTVPGQNMSLTFSGSLNQRVFVDLTNVTIGSNALTGTRVTLIRPNGATLGVPVNVGTNGGYIDLTTLPVAGTYTIKIDPQGANTGSIKVWLYPAPADVSGSLSLLTSGSQSGTTVTTTVPGQNISETFSGTLNHSISLDISSVSIGSSPGFGATVTIYKPDGTILVSGFGVGTDGKFMEPVKLPVTGTYKIKIDPVGDNTGSATLKLFDVPADVNAGTLVKDAASLTSTTVVPGQNATATFAGTAGDADTFSVDGANTCSVQVTMTSGSNTVISNFQMPAGASDNIVLPVTGTYTVKVDYLGNCYGAETFALSTT